MTVTPTPAIDALDGLTLPNRGMLDGPFVDAANAWTAATPTFGAQVKAVGDAAEANARAGEAAAITAEAAASASLAVSDYVGVTTALLNHVTGSQTFTMTAGLAFNAALTPQVAMILLSNDGIRMTANVTAYNAGTGVTTVNVTRLMGTAASGTGWAVMLKAFEGLSPEEVDSRAAALALIL